MLWGLAHIKRYSGSFKNRVKAKHFRRYILNIFLIEKIKVCGAYLIGRKEDCYGHIDTLSFQRNISLALLQILKSVIKASISLV